MHSRSFLNWLGGVEKDQNGAVIKRQRLAPGATLEVLWLENCHDLLSPPIDEQKVKQLPARPSDEGFEWVRNLSNLQSLSFRECACISSEYVDRANKAIWKIAEVILPYAFVTQNSAIEVDPLLS